MTGIQSSGFRGWVVTKNTVVKKKKKKKRKITHGCKFHEPFLRDTSGGGDCRNRTANRDPSGKLREKKRSTFIGEKFVLEERFI